MRKYIMVAVAVLIAALGFTGVAQAQPRYQPIANCTTPEGGNVPLPQHYLSYTVTKTAGFKAPSDVTLQNNVSPEPFRPKIGRAIWHWNPACKFIGSAQYDILAPDVHYLCFSIKAPTQTLPNLTVTDQFGTATLELGQPDALCLPSWKSLTGPPDMTPDQPAPADHYTCYPVENPQGSPTAVKVQDEFSPNKPVKVTVNPLDGAQQLCAPTQKTVGGTVYPIGNPDLYYWLHAVTKTPRINPVWDQNQFGQGQVNIGKTNYLCVPASVM